MRVKRASGLALSEAGENYIKALFELSSEDQRVTTTALAEHLGVAPASVTGMLKKLAAERPSLVEYRPRRGASLSPLGRRVAAEVIRHHRLIELYLHQALGFSADVRALYSVGDEALAALGTRNGGAFAFAVRPGISGRTKLGIFYFATFELLRFTATFQGLEAGAARQGSADSEDVTNSTDQFLRFWVGGGYAF